MMNFLRRYLPILDWCASYNRQTLVADLVPLDAAEVHRPRDLMDRLKRSHFLHELTGKGHLTQFEAVSSINPDLANRTMQETRQTPDAT